MPHARARLLLCAQEHLKSDKVKEATEAHSDIDPAWIFPESPDSKLPVGGTTDLLVALANGGAKMFNVSHVAGQLLDASGKLAMTLDRFEYGQSLGPMEQRSFRFPLTFDAEMALGEYTLIAKVYYNTRDKEPYVSLVCKETVELVPPLPTGMSSESMMQAALGLLGVIVLGLLGSKAAGGGGEAKPKAGKKGKAEAEPDETKEDVWLAGTLAGAEKRSPRKAKKA